MLLIALTNITDQILVHNRNIIVTYVMLEKLLVHIHNYMSHTCTNEKQRLVLTIGSRYYTVATYR
jgi:hypothetical protein